MRINYQLTPQQAEEVRRAYRRNNMSKAEKMYDIALEKNLQHEDAAVAYYLKSIHQRIECAATDGHYNIDYQFPDTLNTKLIERVKDSLVKDGFTITDASTTNLSVSWRKFS